MKKLLVPAFCLLLAACGAAEIITIIDAAVAAGVNAAESAGDLTPAQAAYFDVGLACSAAANTELATMDTPAQKALAISSACLAASQQVIPAGLPSAIAADAATLLNSAKQLAVVTPATVENYERGSFVNAFAEKAVAKKLTPTKKQIEHMKSQNAKIAAARKKLKK